VLNGTRRVFASQIPAEQPRDAEVRLANQSIADDPGHRPVLLVLGPRGLEAASLPVSQAGPGPAQMHALCCYGVLLVMNPQSCRGDQRGQHQLPHPYSEPGCQCLHGRRATSKQLDRERVADRTQTLTRIRHGRPWQLGDDKRRRRGLPGYAVAIPGGSPN